MNQVGMRELKENMGRFVSLIKRGQKITLNYRGRPLALVSSLHDTSRNFSKEERFLTTLEEKGLISGGKGRLQHPKKPFKIGGRNISDFVTDSRE